MIKIIKTVLVVGYFIGIISISITSFYDGYFLEGFIDWIILGGLILYILQGKKSSRFSLYSSFALFIFSVSIITVGFKAVGEFIMRLSFICLLVGFVQSFFEYKRKIVKSKKD